ncbi:MAG: hypothetical protein GY792_37595 [Gammaproteobacteria bacterium]|nr:hypothetical protein [Gammaproteobacteria bacterium]
MPAFGQELPVVMQISTGGFIRIAEVVPNHMVGCNATKTVLQSPTSERPLSNNCGHSRGGQFNSQDARYCRFGLMALSLMTGHPTWMMLRVKSASGPKML